MRHVYIRGLAGLVWLAAAIGSGISGKFELTVLYILLGGVFLYTAYTTWKNQKNHKGGR